MLSGTARPLPLPDRCRWKGKSSAASTVGAARDRRCLFRLVASVYFPTKGSSVQQDGAVWLCSISQWFLFYSLQEELLKAIDSVVSACR